MNYFVIEDKLPSLNDYVNACRRNKFAGAKFKEDTEYLIALYIRQYKNRGNLHKVTKPCVVNIEWHEKTKRRDVDNIQSGQKYILDALQKQGILENDNRKWVKQINHKIIDDNKDYVVVEFLEEI